MSVSQQGETDQRTQTRHLDWEGIAVGELPENEEQGALGTIKLWRGWGRDGQMEAREA